MTKTDAMPPAIRKETQDFSDAMMMLRYVELWAKECALEASSRLLKMQKAIMADPNSKLMAMDLGDVEAGLLQLAAGHGEVKRLHALASATGRKINEPMPKNPTYPPGYLALIDKEITIAISGPARR